MIDLGNVHGKRLFYTGNRTFLELLEAGEITALPDGDWIMFKRTEILTQLERQAAFTIDEIKAFYAKHESENKND